MEFVINNSQLIVLAILVVFGILELAAGLLDHSKRTKGDYLLESFSYFSLSLLVKPGIVLAVMAIGNSLVPTYSSILSNTNFWLALLGFLLFDDILQYWYHRFAHEYQFLWKLYRLHHLARDMGLLVSYRNAALYYAMMPNIWWIGLFRFFGGGAAVAVGLILKQFVIIGSHSPTRWDRILYHYKFFKPAHVGNRTHTCHARISFCASRKIYPRPNQRSKRKLREYVFILGPTFWDSTLHKEISGRSGFAD